MADTPDQPQPTIYHIQLQGHLDSEWEDWFGDVTVTSADNDTTLLICHVIDQSALYGLLRQIRDLGLLLLSLHRIDPQIPEPPHKESKP